MASVAIKLGKALPLPFLMALLAGSAVALAAFLAPTGLIEALVTASGLPSVLAAAAPPLGMTARALLAIGGGAVAMVATAGGLVLADRIARAMPRRNRPEPLAVEEFAPRRRILAVSDEQAPRRPIFAESDLGASLDLVDPAPADAALEAYPFGHVEQVREEQSDLLDLAPIAQAMWRDPVVAHEAASALPDVAAEADESEFVDLAPDEVVAFEELAAEPVPVFAKPASSAADYDALSLAQLLLRLEVGLERRRQFGAAPVAPAFAPRPAETIPAPSDMDEALRDALGTLRRMSARSH